jgi:Tc5 transposase DNA-binding domain
MHERTALGDLISDTTLREQARAIARQLGIGDDQFKASGGWIENFKQRHKIRRGKFANERAERGVGARRGSFSPGGDLDESTGRRGISVHVTPNGFNAADTYAQLYGSGPFRQEKIGSGVGGDDERDSIASSADDSGSLCVDDDGGGVAPMMATFSLTDKRPHSGGMPPPAVTSNANGSPRSSINRSPRMLGSPATSSRNNMPPANDAPGPASTAMAQEHNYGTRSKTINPLQLQQSVRMMSTFIRDVYPTGFTDGQREMWDVMERRTLEWARAQKSGGDDVVMGDDANVDASAGEKESRVGRTRSKSSNGI